MEMYYIMDKNHRLMYNVINYYKIVWLLRKPFSAEFALRRIKMDRDLSKIECKDFYKFI